MIRVTTKRAKQLEDMISKKIGEVVQIRKGCPDARYKEGYYLYQKTWAGCSYQTFGTYGKIIGHSKTLKGLLTCV